MDFNHLIEEVKRYRQVVDNPSIKNHKDLKKVDMHVHSSAGKEFLPGGKIKGEAYSKFIDKVVDFTRIVMKVRHPKKEVIFHRDYELFFRLKHTPIQLFNIAMKNKMDYFALTDHDTIDGCLDLIDNHPKTKKKLIFGEEVSTKFPEENFALHLGVFGLNEKLHDEITEIKGDVYELVKFLKEKKLLFALNHMGNNYWGQGRKIITPKIISKCLNLFDIFEARNANEPFYLNTVNTILYLLYNKGMIAGSDTHEGRVGATHTAAIAEDKNDFLQQIRKHQTYIYGEHGTIRAYKRQFLWMYQTGLLHFNDKYVDLRNTKFYNSISKIMALYTLLRSRGYAKNYYKDHVESSKIAYSFLVNALKSANS